MVGMTNNEKTVFRRLITNPNPQQYVILNSFNTVQFAHTRHSSSKLGFALVQSQISGSVRGEEPVKARGEMLN